MAKEYPAGATSLACGCVHNDTHWLHRCASHAAWDEATSERWARERKQFEVPRGGFKAQRDALNDESWLGGV